MPPCKTIKTYDKKSKNHSSNLSKSVDAFNALFAQNLTKRLIGRKRKPRIKLMELPARTETCLTDSSVTFNAEETFDKVRKGKVFNKVKVVSNLNFHDSSSDISKSRIPQVSVSFHSPIMTRKRLKQNSATISSAGSTQEILVQSNKSSTLDKPVTSGLLIEKEEKKMGLSSLSYIHLPKITENKVISETCDNSDMMEWTHKPIFSSSFRERQTVHSSTPYVVAPFKKIVVDPISPICKSDSQSSSNLIEKSYDEIRKWDSNFPILENGGTPKGPVLRSSSRPVGVCVKIRRRKSVTRNCCGKILHDWKLNVEPKVYLKSADIIDFRTVDQKLQFQPKVLIKCDAVADFKGFTEVEKFQSTKNVNKFKSLNRVVFNGKTKSVCKMKQFSRKPLNKAVENSVVRTTIKNKGVNDSADSLRSSVSTYLNSESSVNLKNHTRKIIISSTKTLKSRSSKFINNKVSQLRTKKKLNVSEEETKEQVPSSTENHEIEQNKIESDSAIKDKRCFVTVRERKVNIKNNDQHISNNIKKITKKCMQFKNVTDDILSEKEVSYTSISKCELYSEKGNSVESVITQNMDSATDGLTHNLKENNVPKLDENDSLEVQSSEGESACLTLNFRDFDKSEGTSCAKEEFDETVNNSSDEGSILLISDDTKFYNNNTSINLEDTFVDQSKISNILKDHVTYSVETFTHDQELCLPKLNIEQLSEEQEANLFLLEKTASNSCEQKLQTETLNQNILENITDELLQSSNLLEKGVEVLPCKTPLRSSRSLDFIIPSRNASKKIVHDKNHMKRSSNAKIIILSDISLGFPSCHNDTAKICQDIYHDHSYTSLPQPEYDQYLYGTSSNSAKDIVAENDAAFTESQHKDPNISLSDIIESSLVQVNTINENSEVVFQKPIKKFNKMKTITLRAGKTYRRSLSILRRSSVFDDVLSLDGCPNDCLCAKCLFRGKLNQSSCRRSFQIVPASSNGALANNSILETYARKRPSYVQEQDLIDTDLDDCLRNLSLISESRNSLIHHCDRSLPAVTAKDIVLRRCGQTEILPFEECYPRSILQHCQKIGEGVYGEVFLCRNPSGGTSVMKIIPIEGDLIVNGEKQKKFEEIVSEIVISMELSNLRNNKKNFTSCFTELQNVRCTRGSYPDRLLDLWELYDETRGSENDSPQMFPPDQLYIVLELANGGQDLESYIFTNALQVFAVFKQTACALAVAESQLKFEHRDLHWGNILISSVDKNKTLHFRLNGKDIEIDTHGVEVSIIDFTLSRVEFDGVVIFNDLSHDDELFVAKGDYQFEIYRLMQQNNNNEWQDFEPYSNILWLHYLLDKAVTSALRYKNNRTKIHKEYLGKLRKLKDQILSFHSVVEFVVSNFI